MAAHESKIAAMAEDALNVEIISIDDPSIAAELSHDPTNEINDGIDAGRPPKRKVDPLAVLATMSAGGDISPDERDAGEIYHRLGRVATNGLDGGKVVTYPWRSAEGKWSQPSAQRTVISAKFEAAGESIKTPQRRQAVTLALVAREPRIDLANQAPFVSGLEDLTRHFWGATAGKTTKRNGVTLAATSADNDATAERLAHDNDNSVDGNMRVFHSPFHRMMLRGQLDAVPAANETLYAAGVRYYQDWYFGGLGGISAIDYGKVGGGGGDATAMPKTEWEAQKRAGYRAGRALMTDGERQMVEAVVLDEATFNSVANRITAIGDNGRARATAKVLLRGGLTKLALAYGLMRQNHAAA